jgi:hypothetical protein
MIGLFGVVATLPASLHLSSAKVNSIAASLARAVAVLAASVAMLALAHWFPTEFLGLGAGIVTFRLATTLSGWK